MLLDEAVGTCPTIKLHEQYTKHSVQSNRDHANTHAFSRAAEQGLCREGSCLVVLGFSHTDLGLGGPVAGACMRGSVIVVVEVLGGNGQPVGGEVVVSKKI